MNGILILAEDIISVAGGGLAWANTGHNAGQLSKLVAVCWTPLTGDWWDYSYLITDIHQVTKAVQLPQCSISTLSTLGNLCSVAEEERSGG